MQQSALQVIYKINQVLEERLADPGEAPVSHGLFNGLSGIALYYVYLYRHFGDAVYEQKALSTLHTLFNSINGFESQLCRYTTICSGIAGWGHLMKCMQDIQFAGINISDDLTEINRVVYEKTLLMLASGNTDFLHGATGQMYYLSAFLPDAGTEAYLETLTDALLQLAVRDEKGIRFPNSTAREFQGTEDINLSLSHGHTGILWTLLRLYIKGVARQKTAAAIKDGIHYLFHYYIQRDKKRDAAASSAFPLWTAAQYSIEQLVEERYYEENLSWCYGDMGAIWLLYHAGQVLDQPHWISLADEIGEALAAKATVTGFEDKNCHFCHGTAGVAQFFLRLHMHTGKDIYRVAYDKWLAQSLQYFERDMLRERFTTKDTFLGVLEGITGLGLVLLSYLDKENSSWDSMFLLSSN